LADGFRPGRAEDLHRQEIDQIMSAESAVIDMMTAGSAPIDLRSGRSRRRQTF
jgi:hypothetical protein